jgi:hypothetical protein
MARSDIVGGKVASQNAGAIRQPRAPRRHPPRLAMPEDDMCKHQPPCPDALAPDRIAARLMVSHPEQGWSLLCNGVVLFDDAGVMLPGGQEVGPRPMVSAGELR